MRHALQQVASLIACLTLSFAVLTTSAVAQGRDEPPIEQIKLTEAQVALEELATVVKWSNQGIVWVQGPLLVALRPAWGPQTAERLYTELQGVLPQ